MGNLMASLGAVAESMRTMQRSIDLTANNVSNAKTPGYVRQNLALIAKRFEVHTGLAGGVDPGPVLSARKQYLEQSVREQAQRRGRLEQQTTNLQRLEPVFDIAAQSGVAGSLDAFFGTISQWSLTPNDAYARQRVLEGAGRLVDSFHFIVKTVNGSQADSKTEVTGIVDRINRLGETVQSYNREVRGDARKLYDPGLDAQLHAALEELSEYVDFDVVKGNEGSIQVLIGGQTHLTIGDNFYPVSADFSSAGIVIRDAAGKDVTAQIQQGKLRGSLDFHNGLAPGLVADLDTLAIAVADRVNAVLAGGLDLANQPGAELFTYDAAGGAAATIRVNNITPAQLAAALPGAPGGNGNALQLAALSTSKQINDVTFTEFYGGIAGKVGNLIGHSRQDERTHALLLAQARNIRAQETEVDLDEEASKLVAFQRQYEANAELFRVLNGLTETLINLIR